MNVFVDTSAFVALENRRDAHHADATKTYRKLIRGGAKFVTSDFVLDETVTLLRARASAGDAVAWGRRLLSSMMFELHLIDRSILVDALRVMEAAADQRFSFTDCTSFVLVSRERLEGAFAFDDDFQRFGIRQLP